MSGGRRTTPLFDLLSAGAQAVRAEPPARPSKPVVRVELKPQDRPAAPPPPAPRAEPRVSAAGGAFPRFSPHTIGIGVAIGAVMLIGTYILGVKIGERNESKRVEQQLGGAFRPPVSEPGASPAASDSPRLPVPTREASGPTPKTSGAAPPSSARVLSGDPREVGLNYMALAVLGKADCDAAVQFLAANGLDAFAIPVDAQGNEVNNPGPGGRYRLYVLPGITKEQYSSNQTVKTNLEAKVAQVGQVWQKQHRGSSNFASHEWRKMK